ncbi:F-box only protein 40-like [Lampris incognitus]|uniref:F-box only protein 40-like n=1 Tax=Lampris incognitus TaxID=2546036 RepID=UPI0024B51E2A|nr:F-box only protein 40-like [Lampris incognitus]
MGFRSQRFRRSKSGLHVHCESCYSRRCRTRVEVSVSCAVVPCRLLCGAVFHLCKEEEHLLLCPNVRVPCLNAEYGCPLTMTRSCRGAHLQACPASVVCCSMEWNRWPAEDAHAHPNTELHENLLKDNGGERPASLDLAMALKDQDCLFRSLKMRKLFPELIQSTDEEERKEEEKRKQKDERRRAALQKEAAEEGACGHTWQPMSWVNICPVNEAEPKAQEEEWEPEPEPELTQEEREALARSSEVNVDLYSAWEHMFSMEMGGCREAGVQSSVGRSGKRKGLATLAEEDTEPTDCSSGATARDTCVDPHRQARSMGTVTDTASSSSSSCSIISRKRDFVYGHVEPMKIISVRTFKIPTSFMAKQVRIRNPGFYKRESRGVDTSDLGVVPEDMPVWEEVQASLLCSLEKEQRGHLIAEGTSIDALLQDEGTQTYSFLSAPFHRDMSLAHLTADKPLELHLQLQAESVTSRHHKASSAFTFLCGHTFQRREYTKHFRNVHSDIQMCASGWFEQRCPLAYLGCTFSQRRFQPSTHEATVTYNQELGSFNLRPTLPVSLEEASLPPRSSTGKRGGTGGGGGGRGERSLSALPYEVLCHVASFLDSLSLSQLALVSRLMRDVCSSLLQERGMVTLRWERESYSHDGAKWRAKQKVWQFSTLFSPVDSWCLRDIPSMSEHLKVCPYYQRELRSERIPLPRIREGIHANINCKGATLVGLFQREKIMM